MSAFIEPQGRATSLEGRHGDLPKGGSGAGDEGTGGYDGLFDHRLGKPSPKRVPVATVEEILRLYQEQYVDFNVRHFHEKLVAEHDIKLSYTWVKQALQGAGLVQKGRTRGGHRN